ncbi:uncharacterized protein LOC141965310 isoform X1 [Athene noctua]|uniref:uncharacterized protein LOC141965310 isoform X1 n=1 Tax=Athene noctua TaxID=126797 RepID=UPI003EBE4D31
MGVFGRGLLEAASELQAGPSLEKTKHVSPGRGSGRRQHAVDRVGQRSAGKCGVTGAEAALGSARLGRRFRALPNQPPPTRAPPGRLRRRHFPGDGGGRAAGHHPPHPEVPPRAKHGSSPRSEAAAGEGRGEPRPPGSEVVFTEAKKEPAPARRQAPARPGRKRRWAAAAAGRGLGAAPPPAGNGGGTRPVGPFVPGSRTGCGGTLDVLKDYDSAVAALAVLYHVWQRSHILPSRLLHTQPSGLHFPADPSSWMTELFGTCRVSLPGCPSTLHLGHKIHPCSSRVRGL